MTKNELLELDGTKVNLEVLEEVDEIEEVLSGEIMGLNGAGENWYLVTLEDMTEINLYY